MIICGHFKILAACYLSAWLSTLISRILIAIYFPAYNFFGEGYYREPMDVYPWGIDGVENYCIVTV